MGYAVNCEDWHCTHRELNKFDSASDTRYVKLKSYINSMREPSALDKAYDIIRADCYDHERLMINRLSGDEISLENCYINLDLIELNSYRSHNDRNGGNGGSGHAVRRPRWFSSLTGFEIREPTSDRQITLVDLFDARRTDNNLLIEPRKILIKGSAGVGKSTLCKKIVYEHTHLKRWNNIFDRVLWIPLRRMQASSNNPVLREMLKQEFFSHRTDSDSLATDLLNGLDGDSFGRTLFLLDGLDEVHQSLNRDNTLHTLLRALISKPNVVITTRPHIVVPSSFVSIDMELKVVGFTLKQVSEYIGITESEHAKEIHEFLARNKIVRDLARIPVQLDALCYTWDEGWKEKKQPKTMTGLYRAIEAKLWRKDFKRRDTKGLEESDSMSDREIAKRAARSGNDAQFVELVAFAGICLQVYEFDSNFCDDLLEQQDLAFPPDGESLAMRLNGLSFIRSSDRSAAAKHQTYHFIHLTYQEYFAARYFARQWTRGESHLWIYNERVEVFKFIHKVKYAPSHDIFWRFVIGLLDDKARERLFDPLSQHPDLTSLMHQSLVMNCMTEVEDMSVLKKELDENLSDWLRNFKASFDGLSLFEFGIGDADVTEGRLWTKPWALETPRTVSETLSGTYSTSPVLKAVYQRIDHDDKLVREMVTFILSQHDNLPESIIEAAMGRLGDIDEDTRSSVLKILKRQRSLSKHQLETTVSLLFNEQRGIRLAAADLVSSLAIDGCFRDRQLSFDFQRLYDLREDPEQSIRRASISLLTGIQEPTDEALCHILIPFQSDDTSTRHFLKSSLSHLVSLTADRLQSLLSQLPCDHPRIRFWAVEILRNQKDLSPSFLRSIADLIVDRDVSMDAVFVIASLASLPEELVEALTTIIQGVDQAWVDVFLRHVCSYEWARQTSMAFLRAILPMIGDNNEWTRSLICQILQLRGELPPDILNSVTTYLQSPTGAHESLIGVFAGLDPLPDAVLQILVELLHFDVTQGVKLQVANVLGKRKFLPAPIMQCLDSFLRDVESDVNIIGIIAISGLEELPDSTRCLLLNLLHHGNEKVKLIICHYIGGRETLFAIQVLEALLTDGHVRIRLAASKMCKEFHSTSVVTSELMLTPLVALTKHDLQEIRIQATNTLISWPSSASRTKALTERFEVDCKMAQIHAIRGLRNFTPWNQTLLETLTTKLLDCTPGNLRVRQAILQALEASGDRALPEEIVDAISTLIIDNRWKTQETISTIAAIILRRQHRLADSVIRTITETFQNSSQKKTYPAALESLTGQKSQTSCNETLLSP
ncbi:uncharacterized protein FTOL_13409 [Fusarium torulosum]|uniref:NACHT domain-containing protein n=1 Tax=Fusarium torulosum TaxID=33205 RepID=A0AAE8SPW1_9HYPO|nr:uncharacterized protein FTOL_13409 [Fusarium torulosum]